MTQDAPTALIVDDEPLLRTHLAHHLARLWPELQVVGEARNGREAVDLQQDLRPDVVFLDVHMPGMNGVEAARAMVAPAAAGDPAADAPQLVFVTAYEQYAVQAFEQGAIDYLVKPFEAERLAESVVRLRRRLSERRRLAAAASAAAEGARAAQAAEASDGADEADEADDADDADADAASAGDAAAGAPPIGDAGRAATEALVALPPGELDAILGTLAVELRRRAPASTRLQWIRASVGQTIKLIPVDEVIYFRSDEKYTLVVWLGGEALIRKSIRELLDGLEPDTFIQIHRSAIVNLRFVSQVVKGPNETAEVHLKGRSETLSVSRNHVHWFRQY
jgi:DNA-binding LytR/AlgR family response regulator